MLWRRRAGEKKNVEMFSSGCNLSLSQLQHSRVILQQSPVRRTEVALCLGLTQAHIHLKPLLARLPQSVLLLPPSLLLIHAAAELHYWVFLADLVFTQISEELNFTQSGFCVMLLL